jgi:hypothetical protein
MAQTSGQYGHVINLSVNVSGALQQLQQLEGRARTTEKSIVKAMEGVRSALAIGTQGNKSSSLFSGMETEVGALGKALRTSVSTAVREGLTSGATEGMSNIERSISKSVQMAVETGVIRALSNVESMIADTIHSGARGAGRTASPYETAAGSQPAMVVSPSPLSATPATPAAPQYPMASHGQEISDNRTVRKVVRTAGTANDELVNWVRQQGYELPPGHTVQQVATIPQRGEVIESGGRRYQVVGVGLGSPSEESQRIAQSAGHRLADDTTLRAIEAARQRVLLASMQSRRMSATDSIIDEGAPELPKGKPWSLPAFSVRVDRNNPFVKQALNELAIEQRPPTMESVMGLPPGKPTAQEYKDAFDSVSGYAAPGRMMEDALRQAHSSIREDGGVYSIGGVIEKAREILNKKLSRTTMFSDKKELRGKLPQKEHQNIIDGQTAQEFVSIYERLSGEKNTPLRGRKITKEENREEGGHSSRWLYQPLIPEEASTGVLTPLFAEDQGSTGHSLYSQVKLATKGRGGVGQGTSDYYIKDFAPSYLPQGRKPFDVFVEAAGSVHRGSDMMALAPSYVAKDGPRKKSGDYLYPGIEDPTMGAAWQIIQNPMGDISQIFQSHLAEYQLYKSHGSDYGRPTVTLSSRLRGEGLEEAFSGLTQMTTPEEFGYSTRKALLDYSGAVIQPADDPALGMGLTPGMLSKHVNDAEGYGHFVKEGKITRRTRPMILEHMPEVLKLLKTVDPASGLYADDLLEYLQQIDASHLPWTGGADKLDIEKGVPLSEELLMMVRMYHQNKQLAMVRKVMMEEGVSEERALEIAPDFSWEEMVASADRKQGGLVADSLYDPDKHGRPELSYQKPGAAGSGRRPTDYKALLARKGISSSSMLRPAIAQLEKKQSVPTQRRCARTDSFRQARHRPD